MFSTTAARLQNGGRRGGRSRPIWTGQKTARTRTLPESRRVAEALLAEFVVMEACPGVTSANANKAVDLIGAAVGISGGTANYYLTAMNAFKALLAQSNELLAVFGYSKDDHERDLARVKEFTSEHVRQVIAASKEYRDSAAPTRHTAAECAIYRGHMGEWLDVNYQRILVPTYDMEKVDDQDDRAACHIAELDGMTIFATWGFLRYQAGSIVPDYTVANPDKMVDFSPSYYPLTHVTAAGAGIFKAICEVVFSINTKMHPTGLTSTVQKFELAGTSRSYTEQGIKRGLFGNSVVIRGLFKTEMKPLLVGDRVIQYPAAGTIDRPPFLGDYSPDMQEGVRMLHINCRPLRSIKSMPGVWRELVIHITGYLVYTQDKAEREAFFQVVHGLSVSEQPKMRVAVSATDRIRNMYAQPVTVQLQPAAPSTAPPKNAPTQQSAPAAASASAGATQGKGGNGRRGVGRTGSFTSALTGIVNQAPPRGQLPAVPAPPQAPPAAAAAVVPAANQAVPPPTSTTSGAAN